MAYYIERTRNTNLEDTAIPNLFITDFMPDAPDADFVKVYIYAYMCCRQGIALTHIELAERLGLEMTKVVSAWKYFADRRIVKIKGDDNAFDVEFIDVKGMLYATEKTRGRKSADQGSESLSDPALAALFKNIAVICGAPSIDGGDARRILSWIEEDGATPEIVEFAYQFCLDERGEKSAKYVEKVVKEWTGKNLKTIQDVRDYRAKTDARSAVHKKLMEALGLRYVVITAAEEKKFNLWLDDYGYTPEQLLELTEKTAGVSNKLTYLGGIIRKEREAAGKSATDSGAKARRGLAARDEYYKKTRRKNEDLRAARLEEVYSSLPAVKKIDDQIAALNTEIMKTLTSGMADKKNAMNRLTKEIAKTIDERKKLLSNAGLSPDYTDEIYSCARCNDSGMLENGSSCDCYAI